MIECYTSNASVFQGETITIHGQSEQDIDFDIQIFRKGVTDQLLQSDNGHIAPAFTPTNAYEVGCGWPAVYSLMIPYDWRSGAYVARISTADQGGTKVSFIIKEVLPEQRAPLLVVFPTTTFQAYNTWQAHSLYDFEGVERSNKISFLRPFAIRGDGTVLSYDDWAEVIRWLETEQAAVDYATSTDLHSDPDFLNNYRLLLSIWHDEYWSWEMRYNVEDFISRGGNVCFFSGNTCWWQARFEDDNNTLVCYKDARTDPIGDKTRLTINWYQVPYLDIPEKPLTDAVFRPYVGRPENTMTGVGFRHGGQTGIRPLPNSDFIVEFSDHWVFEGTGLNVGQAFGGKIWNVYTGQRQDPQHDQVVGYECDAAEFNKLDLTFHNPEDGTNRTVSVPQVTGRDGTPTNFIILATAYLCSRGWEVPDTAHPDMPWGHATMGLYRRNGVVFTSATTDWVAGLRFRSDGEWNEVSQITVNLLNRLIQEDTASFPIQNNQFLDWTRQPDSPDYWFLETEGDGTLRLAVSPDNPTDMVLLVDANGGRMWISQGPFYCERNNVYRISCWVWADGPGAFIRLQSMNILQGNLGGVDYLSGEHPGNSTWVYLSVEGMVNNEGPLVPVRVKVEVSAGTRAYFSGCSATCVP